MHFPPRLALALACAVCLGFSNPSNDTLAPDKNIRSIRGLVSDVARQGDQGNFDKLLSILVELGDDPREHDRNQAKWDRELANAPDRGKDRVAERLAKSLGKQADQLGRELGKIEDAFQRRQLADLILGIDSQSKLANVELNNTRDRGTWYAAQSFEWIQQAEQIAQLVQTARSLPIDIGHDYSDREYMAVTYGDSARTVSVPGLRLHGAIAPDRLERILRETLRAAALSKALLGDKLAIPQFDPPLEICLVRNEADYFEALDFSNAAGLVDANLYAQQSATQGTLGRAQTWFYDNRGWLTIEWNTEANYQAIMLCFMDRYWLGHDVQPGLRAGHLNWLCLSYFGTTLPSIGWVENRPAGERTSAKSAEREDALWRAAKSQLYGCRSWLKARMQVGESFPFTSSLTSELGMVSGTKLLKATMVAEYLQATGQLMPLIKSTRAKSDRVAAMETGLGKSMPDFEAEWTSWFFTEPNSSTGLAQRVMGAGLAIAEHPKDALYFLRSLTKVRDQALTGAADGFETVNIFSELSQNALAHARYLSANPRQQTKWPDVHEEYSDKQQYSAEGAWAGSHSVITFTPEPEAALQEWLGTFYHRLPLLEPGLLGIGWGTDGKVAVADITSLQAPYYGEGWVVWPPDGASEVPLQFVPEIPNPVPGASQSKWGYPITLQSFLGPRRGESLIELSLHLGKSESGKKVDCHVLTPANEHNAAMAPAHTYGLIPRSRLKAKTTYTIVARGLEIGKQRNYQFTTR